MKFDLSTIFLVVIAVIPGLFAQRARNKLVPRSFEPQGASAELAELVALGFSTHGILIFLLAVLFLLVGRMRDGNPLHWFSKFDSPVTARWCSQHLAETAPIVVLYVFVSFFVSHWLGFIYGVWLSNGSFTAKLLARATWLPGLPGVTGLLGERPIIYEVLNPEIVRGIRKSVFVEVEMKNGLGFYSGQLSQFAIVKDDEPHKPMHLIDVWFKKQRGDAYESVAADGIMIDLADTATLLVKQVDVSSPSTPLPPTSQDISSLAYKLWVDEGRKDGTREQDWLRAEQELMQRERPVANE